MGVGSQAAGTSENRPHGSIQRDQGTVCVEYNGGESEILKNSHVKILGVTILSLIRYDKDTRTGEGRGI